MAALAKNKRLGVSRGFPDLLVVTPRDGLVFIELKRTKGGKLAPEQAAWLEALTTAGCPSVTCYGAKDAIAFLERYIP